MLDAYLSLSSLTYSQAVCDVWSGEIGMLGDGGKHNKRIWALAAQR